MSSTSGAVRVTLIPLGGTTSLSASTSVSGSSTCPWGPSPRTLRGASRPPGFTLTSGWWWVS